MSRKVVIDDDNKKSSLKSQMQINSSPSKARDGILKDFGCYELKVLIISQLSYIPITSTMLSTAFYEPSQISCASLNFTKSGRISQSQEVIEVDFISLLLDWGEACQNSILTATMSTCLMVGALSGSFFAGWLADAYGRLPVLKACLLLTCVFNGVFSLFATVSKQLSAVLLFILGGGCGGYMVTNLVLLVECLANPGSRLLAVSLNGWSISMVFVAILAWISQYWFSFHLFVAFMAFVAYLAFHFWVLESCRWLAGVHRTAEARRNAVQVMLCRSKALQFSDDWQWWQILGFNEPIVSNVAISKHSSKKYTYLDLFRHSSVCIPLLALFYCFVSSSVVSFGFYFNADTLPGNRYLNMVLMGLSKFFMGLLPFAASSVVGRRPIMLSSLFIAGAGAWFAVISQLFGTSSRHWSLIAVSLTVSAALDPAWKINHLYSAELFPTVVRNMARAFCNVGARFGSVAAPLVVHLRAVHYLVPYLTFALFLTVQVIIVAVFIPETKNRPLPEELPKVKAIRREEEMMVHNPQLQSA